MYTMTWVRVMHQCRFIDYTKCATVVRNADRGGYVWEEEYRNILYFLLSFAVNLILF